MALYRILDLVLPLLRFHVCHSSSSTHTFTVSLSRSLSLSLPVLLAHLHTLTLLARDVHHRYFLIKSWQNALCAILPLPFLASTKLIRCPPSHTHTHIQTMHRTFVYFLHKCVMSFFTFLIYFQLQCPPQDVAANCKQSFALRGGNRWVSKPFPIQKDCKT